MEQDMAIARNTFRELVRGKVLYVVLFFAMLIVLISALFGAVSIGEQATVVKDFGLFACSLVTVAFAIISGATLLQKELGRRTIFNILAKPVKRSSFVIGKFLGILIVAVLMLAIMVGALQLFAALFAPQLDWYLWIAAAYMVLEFFIVAAAVLFFSSLVVTPVLTALFTLGLFLAGRSAEYVLYFIREGELSPGMTRALQALYAVLPHLDQLNVSSAAVNHDPLLLDIGRFGWSAAYAGGYAAVLLVLAVVIFSRRQFY